MTAGRIPVAVDDAFSALANCRRRHVISIVTRTTDCVTVDELATNIAAIEHQRRPTGVTSDQRASVYISLTQHHLDKLATIGIIDYDARAKQVETTTATRPLARYIHHLTTTCSQPSGLRPKQDEPHRHVEEAVVEGYDE